MKKSLLAKPFHPPYRWSARSHSLPRNPLPTLMDVDNELHLELGPIGLKDNQYSDNFRVIELRSRGRRVLEPSHRPRGTGPRDHRPGPLVGRGFSSRGPGGPWRSPGPPGPGSGRHGPRRRRGDEQGAHHLPGAAADGPRSGTRVRYPAQRERKPARTVGAPLASQLDQPGPSLAAGASATADCRHPPAAAAGMGTRRTAPRGPPGAEPACWRLEPPRHPPYGKLPRHRGPGGGQHAPS